MRYRVHKSTVYYSEVVVEVPDNLVTKEEVEHFLESGEYDEEELEGDTVEVTINSFRPENGVDYD